MFDQVARADAPVVGHVVEALGRLCVRGADGTDPSRRARLALRTAPAENVGRIEYDSSYWRDRLVVDIWPSLIAVRCGSQLFRGHSLLGLCQPRGCCFSDVRRRRTRCSHCICSNRWPSPTSRVDGNSSSALVEARVLSRRHFRVLIGKFDSCGTPRAVPGGQNLPAFLLKWILRAGER